MGNTTKTNIHNDSLAGRRVLVMGLGRFGGGVGVIRWLCQQRADVRVTDQAGAETLGSSLEEIGDLPVRCQLGGHDVGELDGVDLVVINPAVDKRQSEFFQAVVARGVPWTTEINLFCRRCPGEVVAVTGSYGKSTTCAMIAEAIRNCRNKKRNAIGQVHLGGNIGGSLLLSLDRIQPSDTVVLELSNAQLDDLPLIRWSPALAVITNLYPHHLDRYDGFRAYVRAKINVLGNADAPRAVVIGDMHADAKAVVEPRLAEFAGRVVRIGDPCNDIALGVPGRHNQRNAACALGVCEELSLDGDEVRQSLQGFTGLEHRLEIVRTLDGVTYFNDSKSTSPSATVRAVEAMTCQTVAIVGGQAKDVDLSELAKALAGSCPTVVCTGESGSTFAQAIRNVDHHSGQPNVVETSELAEAVSLARSAASAGMAVLFSPGAPSFDAYQNFAHRGREFVAAVAALS